MNKYTVTKGTSTHVIEAEDADSAGLMFLDRVEAPEGHYARVVEITLTRADGEVFTRFAHYPETPPPRLSRQDHREVL